MPLNSEHTGILRNKAAARTTPQSATVRLADFIHGAVIEDRVRRVTGSVLLDTVAVTLAGGVEPGVQALARSLEPSPAGVPSFWSDAAYRADDAATLFGMASHVLDYDDVSMLTVCHPTVPVYAALLPLAWANGVSGRALLDGLAVGSEVLIRLGQAMGFRHYALGFHATGTLGAVGAAAGCARLMELDERQTANSLAIAASMSAGLQKNFGSLVKSLHVGLAAANGLRAARWAAAGIVGAPEPLERAGFLHAFSGGETDLWPERLELGTPYAVVEPGFEQKRYPCCYMLHKMVEAALGLRRDAGITLADVASVRVDVTQGGSKALIHPYPRNGLNALFSAPYALCASLADGRIDLKSFTDQAVLRPALQARLHDVQVVEANTANRSGGDVGAAPVTVTLSMMDGSSLARTITASPGSPLDPLTPEQLARKWRDCLKRANPALPETEADALLEAGRGIAEAGSCRPWLDAIRHAVTP